MSIKHVFSNAIADGTNTQIVRPSDWNSNHNIIYALSGNTIGSSQVSGQDITWQGGNNITLSADTAGSKLVISGPNVSQYLTTAAQSNHSHNVATTTTNGSLVVVATTNSAGATLAIPPYLTTAQSPGAYLTTARASNDAVGLNTALTAGPLAWSVNSSGISINAGSVAGTTSGFTGGASISGSMTHNTAGLAVSLSHPAWITTAMQSNAATISNIRVSAGTTSNLLSAVTFANGGGVSFGLDAGTITATVATNYQSQGAYLTTAMASNRGSDFMGTNTALTANGVSVTANSSGLSLNFPAFLTTAQPVGAYLTTAMASNRGSDFIGTNTALTANGVSMTANSSGLSLNFPAFLTTAMASNRGSDFVQANAAFAGTNASGTIASNGISISVNPAAAGVGIEAGTRTATTAGNLRFETGNGITFGLDAVGGSVLTASHNGLTTAMASDRGSDFVGTNTALTAGPLAWTINSSGLSLNASSVAGTTSAFNGTNISGSMTHNTAGLRLDLSVAAPGGGANIDISAGTTSTNASAFTFSNANNITWGLGTGASAGNITASFNPINIGVTNSSASGTTGTIDGAGAQYLFFGAGGVTASQSVNGSSASLTFSGPATSSISNTGQLSMSVNGSTISLGVPESRNTQRLQWPPGNLTAVAAMGNGSFSINRMQNYNPISATRMDVPFLLSLASSATANTWGIQVTAIGCIYTKNGATLSSLSSGSVAWSTSLASNTAGNTGLIAHAIRPMSVPMNVNMTPGEYYVGFGISTNTSSIGTATTALGNTWSVMGGPIYSSAVPQVGDFTAASNTSTGLFGGQGIYSAAISTVPPTVSLSAINHTGSYYARANMGIIFRNQ